MEKEIRLSFFRRMKMSIFDFDKYHIIASEGLGRAMMYLIKLMLLFALSINISNFCSHASYILEGFLNT